MSLPVVRFFPGGKSCHRASLAALEDYGVGEGTAPWNNELFVPFGAQERTGKTFWGGHHAARITKVYRSKLIRMYELLERQLADHPVLVGLSAGDVRKSDGSKLVTNKDAVTHHYVTAVDHTDKGIGYIDAGSSARSKSRFVKQDHEVEVLEDENDKTPKKETLKLWTDPGYAGVGAVLTQVGSSRPG